jgi:hypothetical protein
MSLLDDLTVALFVAWCLSEVAISLINVVNRLSRRARAEDRFSFLGIWLALIVTVALAMITWLSRHPMAGLATPGHCGSLSVGWAVPGIWHRHPAGGGGHVTSQFDRGDHCGAATDRGQRPLSLCATPGLPGSAPIATGLWAVLGQLDQLGGRRRAAANRSRVSHSC